MLEFLNFYKGLLGVLTALCETINYCDELDFDNLCI